MSDYVSPLPDEPEVEPEDGVTKSHVPNYVAPIPEFADESDEPMDRSHIKLYVAPLPGPEDEPEPDPAQVAREAYSREVAEHAALVRRLQDEDRKRAAKSAEPNTEGQV